MQERTMQSRMSNPAFVVPDAMQALQALGKAVQEGGVPPKTLELVNLRASQINGCGVCAVQHPRIARKLGETDKRIFAVTAWRLVAVLALAALAPVGFAVPSLTLVIAAALIVVLLAAWDSVAYRRHVSSQKEAAT